MSPLAVELLLPHLACCFDSWWSSEEKTGEASWDERQQLAAQFRASAILSKVNAQWRIAVLSWRALLRQVDFALDWDSRLRITDVAIRYICSTCPALTQFDLSGTKVTDASLDAVARCCPRIQVLMLQRNGLGGRELSDVGMITIATCANLQHLHLANLFCPQFTVTSLQALAHVGTLTRINLTGSDTWLTNEMVVALAACSSLRALLLGMNSGVRDTGLYAVAAGCPCLTEVDVSSCRRLTDAGVMALAALPLEHLELANCPAVTDPLLYELGAHCNLDAAPAGVPTTVSTIRHLSLGQRGFSSVSTAGLLALSPICRSLAHLNLQGCAAAVTDAALEALGPHLAQLRVLDLGRCDEMSERGLCALISQCPRLERLNLEGCSALNDSAASVIAVSLPGLRWLGCDGCDNLTQGGLKAIQAALPAMVHGA